MNRNLIFINKDSSNSLTGLEAKVEHIFLKDIRQIILEYNGKVPKINNHYTLLKLVSNDVLLNTVYIQKLISVEEIIEQLDYVGYLNDFQTHFELSDDYVEAKYLLPIADHSIGSILIAYKGKHQGKIYYADSGDNGIVFVANNFNDFLNLLEDSGEANT